MHETPEGFVNRKGRECTNMELQGRRNYSYVTHMCARVYVCRLQKVIISS